MLDSSETKDKHMNFLTILKLLIYDLPLYT